VLASALSYAIYLVYSGQAVKRLGALRITGIASSVACVLCIVQFFVLRPPAAMLVSPEVIGLSVINATLCTVLPVILVMSAVERVGAPVAAQAGTVGPLSTIFMSVLILHEPFTGWLAAGTVLVLLGIWLLTRWK
jgi:drug/metabolite transporter (DMT)-like permease